MTLWAFLAIFIVVSMLPDIGPGLSHNDWNIQQNAVDQFRSSFPTSIDPYFAPTQLFPSVRSYTVDLQREMYTVLYDHHKNHFEGLVSSLGRTANPVLGSEYIRFKERTTGLKWERPYGETLRSQGLLYEPPKPIALPDPFANLVKISAYKPIEIEPIGKRYEPKSYLRIEPPTRLDVDLGIKKSAIVYEPIPLAPRPDPLDQLWKNFSSAPIEIAPILQRRGRETVFKGYGNTHVSYLAPEDDSLGGFHITTQISGIGKSEGRPRGLSFHTTIRFDQFGNMVFDNID